MLEQHGETQDGWNDLVGVIAERSKPGINHTFGELQDLVKRINAEGPVYFKRDDGLLTPEPWFVRDIRPIEYTDGEGRQDTVLFILIAPKNDPDAVKQFRLGEFFSERVVGPRRVTNTPL